MEFTYSDRCEDYRGRLTAFMDEWVYPNESVYDEQLRAGGNPHGQPPVMEDMKAEARTRGLWNMFHPDLGDHRLSNVDYAPLAEILGRSVIGPEACNCNAPDTGNMETLHLFATPEQKEQWLDPLLEGEIRSCFAMTEPAVASSDANNIETSIRGDGDDYVINGRKWWITAAGRPETKLAIVMGKSDPDAPPHRQQSMVLVPMDTPGLTVVRSLPVFGRLDQESHCELLFDEVRVPKTNLLAQEGDGFVIAQARLGGGRIHHAMRSIGAAERALELMCQRVHSRVAFGKPLAEQGVIQEWIAESRVEIDQARLLTLQAAWRIDTAGTKGARIDIAMIKVVAPRMAAGVIDRAIQAFGGAGVSDDFVLAQMYAWQRAMRIFDGPDEVHKRTVAQRELRKWSPAT
ncbi:MAG: acyl-CoA dehydrogenase family protein [Acidobacteria bacterium]|nr:acyl-CoA dehydrogenase family protein [Acidobacteriota bacterium]